MDLKKAIAIIILCFLVFWTARIFSINRNPPSVTYYNMGDTVDCGDLELHFAESHLDSKEEFMARFGLDSAPNEGEYKMLSVCIEVTNRSDSDIGWSEVFGFMECGFESPVWCSVIDPNVMSQVNLVQGESLAPGDSQKIWYLTEVNKVCFKESSWEHVNEYQYNYVLSIDPQKTAVRLEV